MSWRESLQRVALPDGRQLVGASFRGVGFFVDALERTGGRRTVTFEFPGRDDPYRDDLGRRARTFPVEGYVLGANYLDHRDDLLEALEDVAGAGELVHPSYGLIRAICNSVTVRESIADGGMARFSIVFEEAPEINLAPTEVEYYFDVVDASATAANDAIDGELAARYDVGGAPSFALASLAEALSMISEALGLALLKRITDVQQRARLDLEVRTIVSNATALVRDPADTLTAFRAAIEAVAESVADVPGLIVDALIEAYEAYQAPFVPLLTATRTQEKANLDALAGALRQVLIVEAARALPAAEYATIEDAVEDRDRVADLLESLAADATDEAYPALVELRSDVISAIPGPDLAARLLTINRRVAAPSLLLCYQLYGSVDDELDLVARNNPQNPAFMSGTIRVLSE